MTTRPSDTVVKAIEAGTSFVTRRCEIYESDGVTPWMPNGQDLGADLQLLVDGTVNVDYDRDERRTLDVTFRNKDQMMRANPNGGFWYDKVIKIFRGVDYQAELYPPSIAIVEALGGGNTMYQVIGQMQSIQMTETYASTATTVDALANYDIVMSYGGVTATGLGTLLSDLYAAGKRVITVGIGNDQTKIPFYTTSSTGTSLSWGVSPVAGDSPVAGSFSNETISGTFSGRVITGFRAGAIQAARFSSTGFANHTTAALEQNAAGGRWLDLHVPNLSSLQSRNLLKAGIGWLMGVYSTDLSWETQMGEFVVDRISGANFPYQIKVTGRDYTKRCINSKIEKAAEFSSDTAITDLVIALAANSGIVKMKIPSSTVTIGKTVSVERGTSRWDIMKQAAAAGNYEMFFDNEGYLVLRPFFDPTTSPVDTVFLTGPTGNLISFDKSVNDSRLYNHICVYGDPADGEEARLPYFGEAKNEIPSSPTRISHIGDRLYTFASQFFTSDEQCQAYAEALLQLHALESYDFNFDSIYYPWLEAGVIAQVLDPDALAHEPDRFLVSTIDFPVGLGPMSLTAKRVTYVGSNGNPL